jgi:hypothetical protein
LHGFGGSVGNHKLVVPVDLFSETGGLPLLKRQAADVFGSPVYVLDGEVFWGQDRIELLADALKSGRAAYRCQV